MKRLLTPLFFLLVLVLSSCSNTPDMEDISWMIGSWQGRDASNNFTWHENWERSGKSFVGSGYTMTLEGDTIFRETLKIDLVDGTPYYVATVPENKGPVLFKLVVGDAHNAVFENREHDFPQRISYKLESNNTMSVELEGIEKGHPKTETLHFERSTGNDIPSPKIQLQQQ